MDMTGKFFSDENYREKIVYNILKEFAKKKGWKEYRWSDGFWMFGPDDEEIRIGIELRHKEWLLDRGIKIE